MSVSDEMPKDIDALPCPFCGKGDRLVIGESDIDEQLFVACDRCDVRGPATEVDYDEMKRVEAVKRWNERLS